jgi:hypothetical protein
MGRLGLGVADMRKFLWFYWQCAKLAARGNAVRANDWQWVVANPVWQSIGSAVGGALGALLTATWGKAPLMSPETPIGIFLGGLFGFVATWILFFAFRFVNTPVILFHRQEERVHTLEAQLAPPVSDIDIALDGLAYESITDENDNLLPPCRAFIVRLTNHGEKFLQNCQILFGADRCIYPVSCCFDLRRGEHKHFPVLRIKDTRDRSTNDRDDRYALVYFLRNSDWKICANGPAWCVPPGLYEVRVLSADTAPAVLGVELAKDSDWKLEMAE